MKYLMIHDVHREYFDLDLDPFHLTFDDGLFSQYYYYPLFKNHPRPLTFFITTAFIRPGAPRRMDTGRPLSFLKSKKYMYRSFIENDYDHFMTTEELCELAAQPNVTIGVHSHFHDIIPTATHARKRKPLSPWKRERFGSSTEISDRDLSIRSKLAFQGFEFEGEKLRARSLTEWQAYIKQDTEECLEWMDNYLGLIPDKYCFPFNEYNPVLLNILKTYGFKQFFAARAARNTEVTPRTDIDSLLSK